MRSTIPGGRRRWRVAASFGAALTALTLGAVVAAWWMLQLKPTVLRTPQIEWDESDTWAFDPPPDSFKADALLDLRSLNEEVAGQSGFVRADGHGGLLRGDGEPIRFWAVNSEVGRQPYTARPLWPGPSPDLDRHARFLAKRGVNLVRLHRQISPDPTRQPNSALEDINEVERDGIWRAVAAYRKQGIYTAISPYWAMAMKFRAEWGMSGGAQQPASGLLFFDERLRTAYKIWMRKLFAEPNPYTGVSLARDPSVALIQIQNEDSLLFWTFNGIQGPQRVALETNFGRFAALRYGSVQAALRSWREGHDGDRPEAGRLELLNLWEMTQARTSRLHSMRLADQTEFLTRTMYEFNADITRFLKEELGVGALINAGNWRTASAERLGDAERWSYTSADVDAVNRYNGGIHVGEHSQWAIVAGDRYTSDSVLREPSTLPVAIKSTRGRPMVLTEGNWTPPNAHGAEGPLLVAAYGALGGLDGYCWFSTRHEGWSQPRSANGYLPSIEKWTITAPELLGGFPAAALAFRAGYIRPGNMVMHEQRAMDALWRRNPARVVEGSGFDPNRDTEFLSSPVESTDVPSAVFWTGQVTVGFGGDSAGQSPPDVGDQWEKYISNKSFSASTGELSFGPGSGWVRVDTPRVQAVAAHFGAVREHRLRDVTFRSGNAFGAAWAVSLDGAPLATSTRVLLQYTTQSRPNGWKERPAALEVEGGGTVVGHEILSVGEAPWRLVRSRLDVEVRNPTFTEAVVLDPNGNAVGEIRLTHTATSVRLRMPPDAIYVVLR